MHIIDKRTQLYQDLNQIDDNQTIDRYKFLNIYPCTVNELKLLGYSENIVSAGSAPSSLLSSSASLLTSTSNGITINYKRENKTIPQFWSFQKKQILHKDACNT